MFTGFDKLIDAGPYQGKGQRTLEYMTTFERRNGLITMSTFWYLYIAL